MAETYYSIKLSTLTEIGDAIRAKSGATGDIAVTSLATSILDLSPADDVIEWDGTGVVIAPITPEASPSITINGATYNVVQGMTWFTWASNEEYNTDNFQCLTVDSKVFVAEREDYVVDSDGNAVYGEDMITVGGVYSIEEAPTTDELQGTWVFNGSIVGDGNTYIVNFISGGNTYSRLSGLDNPNSSIPMHSGEYLWYYDGSYLKVYSSGWKSTYYKTITITSNLSEVTNGEALLTWLKANATKLEENQTESVVGTWIFGNVHYYPAFSTSVDFTSFNDDIADYVNYTSITLDTSGDFGLLKYDNTTVARESTGFVNDSWKTIIINTEPTDSTFIEWLKANATKQ